MAKLKPEHHDIIAAMGDAGKTDKQIARALKTRFGFEISPSAISWHRLRLGAEPDHRVKVRPVPEQPRVAMRGG
ncbi:MAG TPA: hypothetical protein PLS69_04100, partial [Terricaulis sp.]|nr:hypothetical protein [Terricaulis sp.]